MHDVKDDEMYARKTIIRNDEALTKVKLIIKIILWVFAALSLATGIALAIVLEEALFILVTPVGWLICWLASVLWQLHLSYLCDIKLIRNKLYGESNTALYEFVMSKNDRRADKKKK